MIFSTLMLWALVSLVHIRSRETIDEPVIGLHCCWLRDFLVYGFSASQSEFDLDRPGEYGVTQCHPRLYTREVPHDCG